MHYNAAMTPRALTTLLFFLLGVIVSIAVSWACALWSPQNEFGSARQIPAPSSWPSYLRPCNWPSPETAERLADQGPGVSIIDISGGVFHVSGDMLEEERATPYVSLHVYRFGLPARALQWHGHGALGPHAPLLASRARDAAGLRRGLECPAFLPVSGDRAARRLPIIPIWSGLIIDAVLYGVILWLLIRGPFVLRRRIRPEREQG